MSHGGEKTGYEKSDVNIGKIALVSIVPTILVVGSVIFMTNLVNVLTFKEELNKAKIPDALKERVIKEADAMATTYGKKADGSYRIPIARAMELELADARARRLGR